MAGLRSVLLFLFAVMPINAEGQHKHTDGCFERFGSDRSLCNATEGLCLWVEKDGEGRCLMPKGPEGHGKHADGCFERFGSDKALCNATDGLCLWVEKDGEGKCLMQRHAMDRGDKAQGQGRDGKGGPTKGGHRDGNGGNKSHGEGADRIGQRTGHSAQDSSDSHVQVQKSTGILSISLSSSLTSPEVLERLNQQRSLLEKALGSHVYQKVTILGLDIARRLRTAINTQVHIRFEAEATESPQPSAEARSSQSSFETVLQQSFAKAGLDFRVQSATVAMSSTDVVSRPSSTRRERSGPHTLSIAAFSGGFVFIICTCSALLYMCLLRWSRRSATKASTDSQGAINFCVSPVLGVPCDDDEKCKPDIDLASISTGTPSTSDDISEDFQ